MNGQGYDFIMATQLTGCKIIAGKSMGRYKLSEVLKRGAHTQHTQRFFPLYVFCPPPPPKKRGKKEGGGSYRPCISPYKDRPWYVGGRYLQTFKSLIILISFILYLSNITKTVMFKPYFKQKFTVISQFLVQVLVFSQK